MKKNKLKEVADLIAAMDLKTSFPETADVLKEILAEIEELPLAVVYKFPWHDGSVSLSETRSFCASLPCTATRLGKYCLDISSLWADNWEDKISSRNKIDNSPQWMLPPLTVLTHLSKRIDEVDLVLKKFGLHPLHKGWYRSGETDENGVYKVMNIVTGETALETELKRDDICIRLCYFSEI